MTCVYGHDRCGPFHRVSYTAAVYLAPSSRHLHYDKRHCYFRRSCSQPGMYTYAYLCTRDRHFLNDQEQRNTAETSSQTPTTTTADANTGALPAPPMLPALSTNRRIIYGLLAFVVMLLGTNAYSHQQNRTWEVRSRVGLSGNRYNVAAVCTNVVHKQAKPNLRS